MLNEQDKIFKELSSPQYHLTVVGDEDQCIYSFRGANYYNIADFRNRYKSHSNYAEITLSEKKKLN